MQRREHQRPLLPQHARHCPVLEAGSGLGFLVYPALEPRESYQVEFDGEGVYRFTFLRTVAGGRWPPVYSLTMTLPFGGIGVISERVEFHVPDPPFGVEDPEQITRAFVVPEDLGTPQGRDSAARQHELPDARGVGHGLHARLQQHRAARGADAGRARRDGLAHARQRVPLRAAAGRGHLRRAQPAD